MKTKQQNETARGRGDWQGMNWIRQEKRLAIYLRDGLACVYCGDSVENGASLSLDHLKPASKGGQNSADNLVTCCQKCNSSRGARSVRSFCRATAGYLNHGVTPQDIEKHVRACSRRKLDRKASMEMIARRCSAARVLAEM